MSLMKTARQARPADLPAGYVAVVDHILTLLSERNVRFDAEIEALTVLLTASADSLKALMDSQRDLLDRRLDDAVLLSRQGLADADRRYQQRFDQQQAALEAAALAADRAMGAALASAEKAVSKAEAANEKRFDSVNEFRGQLKDQSALFYPRTEAEQRLSQLSERLDELRNNDTLRTGRSAGSSALYGWIIGGIGTLATIIVIANALFR